MGGGFHAVPDSIEEDFLILRMTFGVYKTFLRKNPISAQRPSRGGAVGMDR
jgi:hypothetical protein